MRRFKQIDAWLQLLLIIVCIAVNLAALITKGTFHPLFTNDSIFFGSYLLVGGFQVTSCLLHLFFIDRRYKSLHRKQYHITLLIIAGAVLLGGILAGFGLLFISPFIAVMYCTMCFNELKLFNNEKA